MKRSTVAAKGLWTRSDGHPHTSFHDVSTVEDSLWQQIMPKCGSMMAGNTIEILRMKLHLWYFQSAHNCTPRCASTSNAAKTLIFEYFWYIHMCLYKTSLGILTCHWNALDHVKKGLGLEDHQHDLQSVFRTFIQKMSTQPQQGHSMSFLHCSASEFARFDV